MEYDANDMENRVLKSNIVDNLNLVFGKDYFEARSIIDLNERTTELYVKFISKDDIILRIKKRYFTIKDVLSDFHNLSKKLEEELMRNILYSKTTDDKIIRPNGTIIRTFADYKKIILEIQNNKVEI